MFLTDFDRQLSEARNGCIPVRRTVMQKMQSEADGANRARLAMLDNVIDEHILIPPKFALYPEVEEVLWRTVRRAIVGQITVDGALSHMRNQIEQIMRKDEAVTVSSNGLKPLSLQESRAS